MSEHIGLRALIEGSKGSMNDKLEIMQYDLKMAFNERNRFKRALEAVRAHLEKHDPKGAYVAAYMALETPALFDNARFDGESGK